MLSYVIYSSPILSNLLQIKTTSSFLVKFQETEYVSPNSLSWTEGLFDGRDKQIQGCVHAVGLDTNGMGRGTGENTHAQMVGRGTGGYTPTHNGV